MKSKTKKIELLYLQTYYSTIFILTIIISIILTINNIKKEKNDTNRLNNKTENIITLLNRLIITILSLGFTYINYELYKENNDNIQKKELISTLISLTSTLILLYASIQNLERNKQNTNINTPII